MNHDLKQYNKLVNDYKEYYFNVYSFLISKGWVIWEEEEAWTNSRGQLWTEYLLSPELNEQEKQGLISVYDEHEGHKFDLIIESSRSIIPPDNFVSNIDKNANIKDVIQGFYHYETNFNKQEDLYLTNKGWSTIELEDVEAYYGTDEDVAASVDDNPTIVLYVSPQFKKGFINKNNAYQCLRAFPNYIVNSNIWWNYDQ
jgi:hypothetical protein